MSEKKGGEEVGLLEGDKEMSNSPQRAVSALAAEILNRHRDQGEGTADDNNNNSGLDDSKCNSKCSSEGCVNFKSEFRCTYIFLL